MVHRFSAAAARRNAELLLSPSRLRADGSKCESMVTASVPIIIVARWTSAPGLIAASKSMQPGLILKDLKQNQPLISEKIALLGKGADPRLLFCTLRGRRGMDVSVDLRFRVESTPCRRAVVARGGHQRVPAPHNDLPKKGSEVQLQSDLHNAGWGSGANYPECTAGTIQVRVPQIHVVEGIEHFPPELE